MANVLHRIIAAAMKTIILTRRSMHACPIARMATACKPMHLMCASQFVSPIAKMQNVSHQMNVNATTRAMKNPSPQMLHMFVARFVHRPKIAWTASAHLRALAIALNDSDWESKMITMSCLTNHWPLKFQTTINRFSIGRLSHKIHFLQLPTDSLSNFCMHHFFQAKFVDFNYNCSSHHSFGIDHGLAV